MMMTFSLLMLLLRLGGCSSALEAPRLVGASLISEGGLHVQWEGDSSEEVLGYKIQIWTVPEHTERMFKLVDGEELPGLVAETTPLEDFDASTRPQREPTVLTAIGRDTSSYSITSVKPTLLYDIRVCAYTNAGDGPASVAWRVKVLSEQQYTKGRMTAVRSADHRICSVAVPAQLQEMGEMMPGLINVHI